VSDDEMAEINRRFGTALVASISAASQMAGLALEFYAERLRRAAMQRQEQAAATRRLVAARHSADRRLWEQTRRPDWWRRAGVEDITATWRAASTWAGVDPRAAEARQAMASRLRERGVPVDQAEARPGDEAWVRAALDLEGQQATAAGGETPPRDAGRDTEPGGEDRLVHTDADRARMAEHVCTARPNLAGLVVDQEAWPALAATLHRMEHQGRDVRRMLREMPDISRARTPAALAVWLLEGAAQAADEQAQADAQRTVERDEQTIEGDRTEAEAQEPPASTERAAAGEQADLAAGQAEVAGERAAVHEGNATAAAATVARAYPAGTRTAVGQARTARRGGAVRAPAKAAARRQRPRPVVDQDR
jgi:hypothetical protein